MSRPTFAEITQALGKSGHQDLFNEDGNIECGGIVIHTDPDVPQAARLATAIASAAAPSSCCGHDAIYEDDQVVLQIKCRADGVYLIEYRPGREAATVVLPKASLHIVSGELIECLGRPAR